MAEVQNKKILILIPDGVGLRNFAFGDFHRKAVSRNFDVIYLNQTQMDLSAMGLREIKLMQSAAHPLTDLLKKARREIELNLNISRFGDDVYDSYRFRYSGRGLKPMLRKAAVALLSRMFNTERGVAALRRRIAKTERTTPYYKEIFEILHREKPALLFSSSQRISTAMAPLYAAKDLGIPTAAFIFSWDNVPKAMLDVDADYYLAWSAHMKRELLTYHSHLDEAQILITGTPQFEPHHDPSRIVARGAFFASLGLDPSKKYICYSGDDVTTSPNDALYLRDVALAVQKLNSHGNQWHILFRRCPVDRSSRFDAVLNEFGNVVTAVDPLWREFGTQWNQLLPTSDDLSLQMNTIAHTELVINLGSSMVFDYASFGKPCAYVNYDYPVPDSVRRDWSVKKTYNFVHFRSMPSRESVVWFNNASEIGEKLMSMLDHPLQSVRRANDWFEIINLAPHSDASQRILDGFEKIMDRHGK